MFKSIKKKAVFLTLACVLLVMGVFSVVSRADSFEIVYTISGNDITITGYTGSTNKVDLPKILEELKADDTKKIPVNAQITSIDGDAFAGCGMEEIVLPTTLKTIEAGTATSGAFRSCSNLMTVTFENGESNLESIGYQAFYNCSSLSQMEIPNTVTTIGYRAFNGTALTSVTIPARINNTNGESVIPAYMFNECTSLASVTLPDNCTSIGSCAFRYTALTTIQLPDDLTTIGTYAFKASAMQNFLIPL